MNPDCIFCRIVHGKIPAETVAETDRSLSFLDASPIFPGHVLVVPKVHVQTISEIPDDLLAPFFAEVRRAARAMELALGAEGSFIAFNNKVSQTGPHLHGHIIPRRTGDGMTGFFWPRRGYQDDGHKKDIAEKLREAFRSL